MKLIQTLVAIVALLMVGCGEEASKEQVKDGLGIPVAIPCMACKKLVSKKSEKCMQCGHPTPESIVAYKENRRLAEFLTDKETQLLLKELEKDLHVPPQN